MRWLLINTVLLIAITLVTSCTRPAPWAGVDWTDGGDPSQANEAGLLDNNGDGKPVAPEPADGDGSTSDTPKPTVPQPSAAKKRVFITSAEYDGDLRSLVSGATSGLAAADALCATAANAAVLGGDGLWVAWLSSDKLDAIDRLKDVGPWYRLDGTKAFNNKTQLATVPLVALGVDEHGREVHRFDRVWTGTRSGGRAGLSCHGFSSSDPFDRGIVGGAGDDDSGWTEDWKGSCLDLNHLICFEQ